MLLHRNMKMQLVRKIPDYNEAPILIDLVKQGKVPPVEERLPQRPLVVDPVEEIGKYGGTLKEQLEDQLTNIVGIGPLLRIYSDGSGKMDNLWLYQT